MRILILEDDPLLGLDLQEIVEACSHEVVGLCCTLSDLRERLDTGLDVSALDFAFLDIDLPDGKSFDLATRLDERRIPFAFVSGSRQADLPAHLRHARFIAKPYGDAAIRNALNPGLRLAS